MSIFDLVIVLTVSGLMLYNLMMLRRVQRIFKLHPALFNYPAIWFLLLLLLALAVTLIIALMTTLF